MLKLNGDVIAGRCARWLTECRRWDVEDCGKWSLQVTDGEKSWKIDWGLRHLYCSTELNYVRPYLQNISPNVYHHYNTNWCVARLGLIAFQPQVIRSRVQRPHICQDQMFCFKVLLFLEKKDN